MCWFMATRHSASTALPKATRCTAIRIKIRAVIGDVATYARLFVQRAARSLLPATRPKNWRCLSIQPRSRLGLCYGKSSERRPDGTGEDDGRVHFPRPNHFSLRRRALKPGQRWMPCSPRLMRWNVPKIGKNPALRRDLPNLEFSVDRPVGFGRPRFKRYKADLRNQTQPLSSWVVPSFETGDYEAEGSFVASTNQEGARVCRRNFW